VLFELRRLERMVEEREGRIAKLERKLAELEHSHRVEKRAAEHAKAALARAEERSAGEAESAARRREALEARAAELEAERRTASELVETLRAAQREAERRLELADEARAEILEERRRLGATLDAAADAMRRTIASRSWRLGHRLARLGATLLLRRPGRASALDSALDDIDRARSRRSE
jgi:chromosome segregation ATPase